MATPDGQGRGRALLSRRRIADIVVGLAAAVLAAIAWALAYEVVCGLRWRPSEGATRWALLRRQFQFHEWADLTPEFFWLAPNHAWRRLLYPPMSGEALLRLAIAGAAVLALGAGLAVVAYVTRPPKHKGDARWGTIADAEGAGLTPRRGVLFGKLDGTLLRSDAPAHILVIGPSRSGKGTSFLLPNGYDHDGSSVWWDVKRENYDLLARHMKSRGVNVFIFHPGATHSHRYNPLDFIRPEPSMPTDCGTVASFIIPERPDDTWSGAGRMLLAALIGYVMTSENCRGQRHLRSVARMTVTGKDISTVLKSLIAAEASKLPAWVCDGFNQYIALEPETRNSAVFNINMAMNPWNNPLISAVTETSDFDIRRLRQDRMAIFLVCSIAELVQFRPIIRILFQQIHDLMMMARPKPKDRHEVLIALDEFRHLGPMPQLLSMLTISAGYKFRMAIMIQSVSMLDELYGKAVRLTTLAGSQVKLFIKIDDLDTANYVSEMLGDRTISVVTPGARAGSHLFAPRLSQTHFEAQPLMSAPELRLLSFGNSILLVSGARPFLIDKVQHYRDQPFKSLLARFGDAGASAPLLGVWEDGDLGPLLRGARGSEGTVKPPPVAAAANGNINAHAEAHGEKLTPETDLPKPMTPPLVEPVQVQLAAPKDAKNLAPQKRRLKTAPPIPGALRDYPASTVSGIAGRQSDLALSQVTKTLEGVSGAAKLADSLVELHTSFGEIDASPSPANE